MTYTLEQAQSNLARLIEEAGQGQEVVIERVGQPSIRLAVTDLPIVESVGQQRIPGEYAGQFRYPDSFFKALETDEELREYGFDIFAGGPQTSSTDPLS
jgi:antitoxin (DNA-binding transcriptional repressor) of toxin-antitoxin stability system